MNTKNKNYDIIIIGGGASGMAAAISSCRYLSGNGQGENIRILILEKKDRPGSKIPATGNGRCNLSNEYMDPSCYRSEDPDRFWDIFSSHGTDRTPSFFEEIGLVTKSLGGYIYPYNEQASSVRNLLESALTRSKEIRLLTDRQVLSVKPVSSDREGSCFQIISSREKFYGKKVIIATGGYAGPAFGCSGDGYRIAKDLGHYVVPPLPALTALLSKAPFLKKLNGVRCHAGISLYIGGRKAACDVGQIQFADYGVSGVVVFQVSRYAVKALQNGPDKKGPGEKVLLTIDFMPDYSRDQVKEILLSMSRIGSGRDMASVMEGLFHSKLIPVILREAGMEGDQESCNISSEKKWPGILEAIKSFPLKITGYKGYDKAQVTQGGVPLDELDVNLESGKHRGLYFTGEVVDVDGICGGYNLQWAWTSGGIAGRAAAEAVLDEECM